MLKTQIDNTTSATIVPRTTAWLLAFLLATTATAGEAAATAAGSVPARSTTATAACAVTWASRPTTRAV